MNTTPEGSMAPQRSWFSRNWKWAVPVGCLGILASCGCLAVIAGVLGFSAIKNHAAYGEALAVAMADDEVQATLGTPMETLFMGQQSSVKLVNGRSTARFSIPLKGPKAQGTLRVDAYKEGEEWAYEILQVEVPGHEPIDLRHKAGGPPREQQPAPPAQEGQNEGQGEEPDQGDGTGTPDNR